MKLWKSIGRGGAARRAMCAVLLLCAAALAPTAPSAPSAPAAADSARTLTYEQIYNSTGYAQLQQLRKADGGLLVGFAGDPFGHSLRVADYLRGAGTIEPRQPTRDKRGVVHLYHMLTCATGCDPVAYKGYGCYCGFGGDGRPADGIDDCCRLHDECYEKFSCPFYTVYLQPYYWHCHRGEPLCAQEQRAARRGVNGCAGRLCDCDRRFALCVRRFACPAGKALCTSSPLRFLQNILASK